jgi:hypothetical protein
VAATFQGLPKKEFKMDQSSDMPLHDPVKTMLADQVMIFLAHNGVEMAQLAQGTGLGAYIAASQLHELGSAAIDEATSRTGRQAVGRVSEA